MSDELPGDVYAVLTQLCDAAATASEAGEVETARQTVETAETVSRNKLAESELRAELLHGCLRVTELLAGPDAADGAAAAAYLRSMERRVERAR